MIFKSIIRNCKEFLLKTLKIRCYGNWFEGYWIPEYKWSECEILNNKVSEFEGQRFGVFIYKTGSKFFSCFLMCCTRRLYQEWDLVVICHNSFTELNTCTLICNIISFVT